MLTDPEYDKLLFFTDFIFTVIIKKQHSVSFDLTPCQKHKILHVYMGSGLMLHPAHLHCSALRTQAPFMLHNPPGTVYTVLTQWDAHRKYGKQASVREHTGGMFL